MLFIIVACILVVVGADETEPFRYENTNDGSGNYRFSFSTLNGITREETGWLKNVGDNNEHIAVKGSYSYTDPDGKLIVVNYIADENGYRILDSDFDTPAYAISSLPPNVVASLLGK